MESPGARLKKIRLEKGLSLEEAHKKTKIHLNVLRALEEDSLIDFNPVYVKGFLKIYCNFLGLDPKDYIPDYQEPRSKVELSRDFPRKSAPLFRIPSLKLPTLKAVHIKTVFTVILIVVFIVLLFKLGKTLSLKRSPALNKTSITSSKIDKTPVSKPEVASTVKIIRLDIRAKENCFVQVKSDGQVIFQNVLRKGRAENWQAMNKIELSLGNAAAVELEVNGKRISALGRRGQALKNILITKEGLTVKR